MTISQEAYNDKKEYWDYQRKLEYNRELLIKQIQNIKKAHMVPNIQDIPDKEVFDMMWARVDDEDLEEPKNSWVPKNENYRLWNETFTKGRPVVLRAKKSENNNT